MRQPSSSGAMAHVKHSQAACSMHRPRPRVLTKLAAIASHDNAQNPAKPPQPVASPKLVGAMQPSKGSSLDERISSGEFTDAGSTKEKLSRPLRQVLAKDKLGPGAGRVLWVHTACHTHVGAYLSHTHKQPSHPPKTRSSACLLACTAGPRMALHCIPAHARSARRYS